MTTAIEYALLAGASYYDTRADQNRFPLPQNWSYVSRISQDTTTGFEASAFTNGTEIVISFAGTGGDGDWTNGNIPLASGYLSDQLKQAADYYLQIKALNPNATISFTGHSLGGGLNYWGRSPINFMSEVDSPVRPQGRSPIEFTQ